MHCSLAIARPRIHVTRRLILVQVQDISASSASVLQFSATFRAIRFSFQEKLLSETFESV